MNRVKVFTITRETEISEAAVSRDVLNNMAAGYRRLSIGAWIDRPSVDISII